jgi:hypothetical protein
MTLVARNVKQTMVGPMAWSSGFCLWPLGMETERDGHLPFLDIDIYRNPGDSMRHMVYSKPTHTNLYLNSNSQHHPYNKQTVSSTLLHKARSFCDQGSFYSELEFLRVTSRQKGCSCRQIRRAVNPPERVAEPQEKMPRSPSCPTSAPLSFASAGRCPGTWSLRAYLRRSPASFGPWRMTWKSRLLVCRACSATAVKCTSGRQAVPSTPGPSSTSATSVWSNQTNQPWPNPASIWASAIISRKQPSSPLRRDVWTGWLRRQSRWGCTRKSWTGRLAFLSAVHGSPSSTPSTGVPSTGCSNVIPHMAIRPHSAFQEIALPWPVPYFLLPIPWYFLHSFPDFPSVVSSHVHPPPCVSAYHLPDTSGPL